MNVRAPDGETMTKAEAESRCLTCQAFNQYLEVCFAPAVKECTDHKGMRWYACDAPLHDTKTGSHDVTIVRFTVS